VNAPGVLPGGRGLIRIAIISYTTNSQGEKHFCIVVPGGEQLISRRIPTTPRQQYGKNKM
jgi:hypothetical protein